ncbi:Rieske (2Fe-2S) protein [Stratiformator vulcanicus]|uniref:Biphenyl dioxygenase ferredoxin subunit n=1 Tax=Stratiformator vulcanicus TaxID=2527980 RepID=A0A517R3J5_9PLAN|nr:Rieske 2Fe-2S domain-containing protein [Stratiformator vulcanicus]QDT38420.1 Biphenyl dioxygenase ferredoxin subunit [Stratiformator vulcanicus]
MSERQRVCAIEDVPPGKAGEFVVDDRIVAIYNVDGKFFALDGVCPHAGGPLGKGHLMGTRITCPWHGWQFDVTTGRHCLTPNIEQQRFEVTVEGDDVFVELS